MFPVVIHPNRRPLRASVLHERAKISKSLLFEQIQIFFRDHFAHRSPPRKIMRKSFSQRATSRSLRDSYASSSFRASSFRRKPCPRFQVCAELSLSPAATNPPPPFPAIHSLLP